MRIDSPECLHKDSPPFIIRANNLRMLRRYEICADVFAFVHSHRYILICAAKELKTHFPISRKSPGCRLFNYKNAQSVTFRSAKSFHIFHRPKSRKRNEMFSGFLMCEKEKYWKFIIVLVGGEVKHTQGANGLRPSAGYTFTPMAIKARVRNEPRKGGEKAA